jgi:hypothetical protein
VAIYGGTAGIAYDPCYHQACDDITNLSNTALDQMSDATAHATLTFAQTTSAVQGTDKGKAKGHGQYQAPACADSEKHPLPGTTRRAAVGRPSSSWHCGDRPDRDAPLGTARHAADSRRLPASLWLATVRWGRWR